MVLKGGLLQEPEVESTHIVDPQKLLQKLNLSCSLSILI